MILTVETEVLVETDRQTDTCQCHCGHQNLTWTDLGLNAAFRGDSLATDRLSWHELYVTIQPSNPVPTSQRTHSVSIMRAELLIRYKEISLLIYFKNHLLNVNRPAQFVAADYREIRKDIQY